MSNLGKNNKGRVTTEKPEILDPSKKKKKKAGEFGAR